MRHPTDDYIALASKVSSRDLTAFLGDWLYGTKTPVMPGYPSWKVDPVQAGGAAAAQQRSGHRLRH